VALRNGLIVCGHPYQTGHVFCHQIIISMDIDDDMIDVTQKSTKIYSSVERKS
jgi:hypothetical protein